MLILFPGLGADERQFDPQRSAFPNLLVPPGLELHRAESLRHYASRVADTLRITPQTLLGGSSFGGMLALEVARLTSPRAVVLIGSCRRITSVAPALRHAGALAIKAPAPLIVAAMHLPPAPLMWLLGPLNGTLNGTHRRLLLSMARRTPAEHLRRAARAILSWPGCSDPGVPVHHIHGARDRVIPASSVRPDALVPDAGHVLNLTHSREVNTFLSSIGA
jgi:pimeloyl-ACP methyl ester carboxylesterase